MNLSIREISTNVFEIYGVIEGRFIKRLYVGYNEEQAINKFTNALEEGEFEYGE